MGETTAVDALSALAQAARLRTFRALVGAGPAGLTPGTLDATLGMPASALSFHLEEPGHAGLLTHCCHGAECDPGAGTCMTC